MQLLNDIVHNDFGGNAYVYTHTYIYIYYSMGGNTRVQEHLVEKYNTNEVVTHYEIYWDSK